MALDPATLSDLLSGVRKYVDKRLRPLERQVAAEDEIPADVVQELRELGLFGLSIPEEHGGLGLGMEEECLVIMELGRTSPAFRSAFGTNVGIGSQGILLAGTDGQKSEWLPAIASGEVITSFALTEPEAGSDAASVRTRAELESDHYVLNGQKIFITNADQASLFTVMARTDPARPGARGVSAFLVPRGLAGITVGKAERKMGQHGTHVCTVTFDDVRVPLSNRLGDEGQGFEIAMRVLDHGRLHIAALCCGIADRLIEEAVAFAKARKQFGKPIAEFQLIQAMIADSVTESLAARALVLETARGKDRGETVTRAAASSKYFASEMVGRVADRVLQIHGGAGYMADYDIERFYRDVRLFRIYEGTSQIQQLIIARETLRAAGQSA